MQFEPGGHWKNWGKFQLFGSRGKRTRKLVFISDARGRFAAAARSLGEKPYLEAGGYWGEEGAPLAATIKGLMWTSERINGGEKGLCYVRGGRGEKKKDAC